MRIRPFSNRSKLREYLIPLFLFLFIFGYVSSYTTQVNIHNDALGNLLLPAKTIVETENLLLHEPYNVMESANSSVVYLPLTYPQLSQLEVALWYIVGGETFLKLFSPLFAALTSLFIYLLLHKRGVLLALLAGLSVVMINSTRIVGMTPLMEQPLLFGVVASIYYYYNFLRNKRISYLVLAGLFIGFTMCIKQQGMIFGGVILIHAFIKCLYDLFKFRTFKPSLPLIILGVSIVIVAFVPIADQIARNGTVEFVPSSSTTLPFFQPKYLENPEAKEAIRAYLSSGYWPEYGSLANVVKSYVLYPMYFSKSVRITDITWTITLTFLLILGLIYLYKKGRLLLSILLSILVTEMCLTYWLGTPLSSYHIIGLAMIAIFIVTGLVYLGQIILTLGPIYIRRAIIPIILLTFILTMVLSNAKYVHQTNWGNPGRSDDVSVSSYENLGNFIESNDIPAESLFLCGTTLFRYYCERDTIWLNPGGGAKVHLILTETDEQLALEWLQYYGIDYIFVENAQLQRRGLGDYMPKDGLLEYIDNSDHFLKIYDDEILRVYSVNYF